MFLDRGIAGLRSIAHFVTSRATTNQVVVTSQQANAQVVTPHLLARDAVAIRNDLRVHELHKFIDHDVIEMALNR